jgi:DNA repair exonuclease SbcCD ATPase subunit
MSDAEFIVKLEAQITQDKADSDQSNEELQAQIDELRTGYTIVRDKSTEYLKSIANLNGEIDLLQSDLAGVREHVKMADKAVSTMHNQVYLATRETEDLESLNLKLFEDTKRLETQLHNATSEKSVILNQAEHWKEKYNSVLAEQSVVVDDDDDEQEIDRLRAQIKRMQGYKKRDQIEADDQLKTQLAELQDVCSMRKEAIDVLTYWCRVLNRNIRTDDDSLQAMVSKAVNSLL